MFETVLLETTFTNTDNILFANAIKRNILYGRERKKAIFIYWDIVNDVALVIRLELISFFRVLALVFRTVPQNVKKWMVCRCVRLVGVEIFVSSGIVRTRYIHIS